MFTRLFHLVSLFHPARQVWVAYPFCMGYGRLKVTRGYPNVIRDNEHRDRISRDGNHESKTDDRKTRIPK